MGVTCSSEGYCYAEVKVAFLAECYLIRGLQRNVVHMHIGFMRVILPSLDSPRCIAWPLDKQAALHTGNIKHRSRKPPN